MTVSSLSVATIPMIHSHTRRTRSQRQHQRGASIMSVLLGLAVIAAGAYVTYDQYDKSSKDTAITASVSDVIAMMTKAQKIYGVVDQYAQVTTAIAVQGDVTGKRRIAGTNTAQNQFNGAITFAPATITVANDALNMGYANVPRELCVDLVSQVESKMRQVQVATTDVKPADGVLVAATLGTQCDSAARVNINFIFGRMPGL